MTGFRVLAALACALLAAGCGSVVRPPPNPAPTATVVTHGEPVPVHDPGHVTGTFVTFHGARCHAEGKLPDPRCTPGAYDPQVTKAVLCAPGYTTRSYRPPSWETNRAKWDVIEPVYGQRGVAGELDHLVPLTLGGANSVSNLWVEAGPVPNAKDRV